MTIFTGGRRVKEQAKPELAHVTEKGFGHSSVESRGSMLESGYLIGVSGFNLRGKCVTWKRKESGCDCERVLESKALHEET